MRRAALALILSSCLTGAAAAQLVPPLNSKPEAYAKPDPIPAARDIPFPGTVQLTVDATDVTRGIFRVHERVPVTRRRRSRPALSQSGSPAATARAATSRMSRVSG